MEFIFETVYNQDAARKLKGGSTDEFREFISLKTGLEVEWVK